MEYHLTPRPNKYVKNKIWYAWSRQDGKRVYRSTGKRLKGDAQKVIQGWEDQDIRKASGTLRAFSKDFFIPGRCPYLAWKSEQGGLKNQTIYEHRKNLKKYILKQFGDKLLSEIGPVEVENWLRTLPLSGSTKNTMIGTFNIVLTEAKRAKLIRELPGFRRFARRSIRCDILTTAEVRVLFPDDELDIVNIWKFNDEYSFMFGLMFRLILHAGMRPGEGRAVDVSQIYPEYNGVLIDRQIDSDKVVTLPKKGTTEDRRERLVIIPDSTMKMITGWIESRDIQETLFEYEGQAVKKEYLEKRFRIALKNAGIRVGERKLVPYSLRYNFRSRMQGVIDADTIRSMMGHRSQEVSDRYLQIDPEQFAVYKPYQDRIDNLWI